MIDYEKRENYLIEYRKTDKRKKYQKERRVKNKDKVKEYRIRNKEKHSQTEHYKQLKREQNRRAYLKRKLLNSK